MPRNSTSGTYTLPPGVGNEVPNTPILSSEYNAFVDDVANEFNSTRPIRYGGTGRSTLPSADGAFAGRSTYDNREIGYRYNATDQLEYYIRTGAAGTWAGGYMSDVPASAFIPHYPNRPDAATTNAYTVAADVRYIFVDGFWTEGDIGPGLYKKLDTVPTTFRRDQFPTNAGAFAWELVPDENDWLNAGAFGIKSNDSSFDSTPALAEFCLRVCALKCNGSIPSGDFYLRTPLVWDLTASWQAAPVIWGKGKGVTNLRPFPDYAVVGPAMKITSTQALSGSSVQRPIFYGSFGYFSVVGAVTLGNKAVLECGNGNSPTFAPPPAFPDQTVSDVYFNGSEFTNLFVRNTANTVSDAIGWQIYGADSCTFTGCTFAGISSQPGGPGTTRFYHSQGFRLAHFNNNDVRQCTSSGNIAIAFKEGKIIGNRFNVLISVTETGVKLIDRNADTSGSSLDSNTFNGGAFSDCEWGIDAPSQGDNKISGVFVAAGLGAFAQGRVVNPVATDNTWGGKGWTWYDQAIKESLSEGWIGRNVKQVAQPFLPALAADDSAMNTQWIRNFFLQPMLVSLYIIGTPGNSTLYLREWNDNSLAAGGTTGAPLFARFTSTINFILGPGESFQWVHLTSTGAGNPLGRTMRLRQPAQ
jgi:hypothetical protein